MPDALVRVLGWPATLIHGDTLVLDRWLWLAARLPRTTQSKAVLDVGCGNGSFTIGLALRGYDVLGLTWDERDQRVARERARICHAQRARFEMTDVRQLDQRTDLVNTFDYVVCTENIEHILNDGKLMTDMARCLKVGGSLLLTTPNLHYRAITPEDNGPFLTVETGWHVRRGYTFDVLRQLCANAGLDIVEGSYCSGLISQKVTYILRQLSHMSRLVAWAAILPLRILPPLFDASVTRLTRWPQYSICIVARREAQAAHS